MNRSNLMSLNLQLWRNTSFLVSWTWPSQRKMRATVNLNHSGISVLKAKTAVLSEMILLYCVFSDHFKFCRVTKKVPPIFPQIHWKKSIFVQGILAVLELDHKSWLSEGAVLWGTVNLFSFQLFKRSMSDALLVEYETVNHIYVAK